MPAPSLVDGYMTRLLSGTRTESRSFVTELADKTMDPRSLYFDLIWPAMERIDKLFRTDRINAATEAMATRINRSIADQLQLRLIPKGPNGKRILIVSAPGETEELGAQMCADLFEANGWNIYLLGGNVPGDEILTLVGQLRPEILLIYGTQPSGVPAIRQMVDQIREIGVNPTMNIMVSGGVFNRADGLWKEVNADILARTAKQSLTLAESAQPRTPEPPRIGTPKKRRRRRRPPLLTASESG